LIIQNYINPLIKVWLFSGIKIVFLYAVVIRNLLRGIHSFTDIFAMRNPTLIHIFCFRKAHILICNKTPDYNRTFSETDVIEMVQLCLIENIFAMTEIRFVIRSITHSGDITQVEIVLKV
jgi:hypothetical protein